MSIATVLLLLALAAMIGMHLRGHGGHDHAGDASREGRRRRRRPRLRPQRLRPRGERRRSAGPTGAHRSDRTPQRARRASARMLTNDRKRIAAGHLSARNRRCQRRSITSSATAVLDVRPMLRGSEKAVVEAVLARPRDRAGGRQPGHGSRSRSCARWCRRAVTTVGDSRSRRMCAIRSRGAGAPFKAGHDGPRCHVDGGDGH